MKRFFFAVAGAVFGVALSAQALTFSVVSTNVANFQRSLYAVAVGDTNFVAVGNNSAVLLGQITTNGAIDLFNSGAWFSKSVPSANKGLRAAAYGSNIFVASGSNNLIFSMTNGGSWKSNGPAYSGNTFEAEGLAFSSSGGGTFAVGLAHNVFARSGVALTSPWAAVTPATNSFLESYRGITPFGTNGFAACGISGVVQVSTDGGLNWSARRLFNYNADPDLLGIATDGTNIVCVGDAAPHTNTFNIVVSTNGGINWFSNAFVMNALVSSSPLATTNPAAKTNALNALHAVTYAGTNGFIAVGPNGLVIVSTDNGRTWNKQTDNFLTNQNDNASSPWTSLNQFAANSSAIASFTLRGAAYGLKGSQLEGVGVVVGDNGTTNLGTMIIFGNPPEQPTNHGNLTTYADYDKFLPGIPAPTLTVDVPKYATADWYDANTGTNLAFGSTSFTPLPTTNWFNNTPATSNYWVYARDTRTGLINTNPIVVTLTVRPRPTASVVGTNTICNYGTDPYKITVNLTGIWGTNFSMTWWKGQGGVVATNNFISTSNQAVFTLQYPNPYYPTNTLLNSATNFFYWVSNLVDTYGNRITNRDVIAGTNLPVYTYTNLAVGTILDLTGTNVVTVDPRPTATLVSLDRTNYNDGSSYTIQANLTGLTNWNVTWWDGVVSNYTSASYGVSYVATRVVYPTNSLPNCLQTNSYWILGVTNINGCISCGGGCTNWAGDLKGTNYVVVRPRPKSVLVSADTNICNYGYSYTIQAQLTGLGPWAVTWWDGAVSNTAGSGCLTGAVSRVVYPTNVLANLPTNYQYWVSRVLDVYSNTNGVIQSITNWPGDLTGTNVVTVDPRPTATLVSLDRTNYNDGSSYTIQANLTGLTNWNVTWWDGAVSNYTSASYGVSYVATRVVYPTNSLPNCLQTNSYWILGVTNLNGCVSCGGGCTNWAGDLKGTNNVVVRPRPKSVLVSADTNICNYGYSYTVQAQLTGLGPWAVTWWDGAVSNAPANACLTGSVSRVVYPTNMLANLPTNYQYWVSRVLDVYSNTNGVIQSITNWPGDLTGTNVVTVDPRPTAFVFGTNTVCNYNQPYLIQANLTGLTNWNVTWWDGAVSNYTSASYGAGYLATRFVYPTNLLANLPTNYQYWIIGVTNINGCVSCGGGCTNWAGDIYGTNVVTVDPRPTATLVSVDWTNYNDGSSYTIQANLTGLTNWNVTWWDGVVSNYTSASYGVSYVATRVVYPTNSLPNCLQTNSYWILGVTNLNGCVSCGGGCTNWAGDLKGTNNVVVRPRPKSVLVSADTNLCNYGYSYTIQVQLTGLGPWAVTWWDGAVSNAAGSGCLTGAVSRVVYPTNVLANLPTNYQYWVSRVLDVYSNTNGVVQSITNWPGDLTGTNTVTVNPRPTASLLSTNQLNYKFTSTNCNDGTSYTITNTLTGFGPWTVLWNDGTPQTVTNIGFGSAQLIRGVYPTNAFGVNTRSNNIYYLTNVTDANSCVGNQTGDIQGTNTITVNPLPTATLTIGTNGFASRDANTKLRTDSNNGEINVHVGFGTPSNPSIPTNFLYVTAKATLTGIAPWTVTWSKVGYTNDAVSNANVFTSTNYYTNSYASSPATFIWTNIIYRGAASGTNFIFSISALSNSTTCSAGLSELLGSTNVTVNTKPTADINVNGEDIIMVCSGTTNTLQAQLYGIAPWTNVYWWDGVRTNNVTTDTISRFVILTNLGTIPTTNYFYLTNIVDRYQTNNTEITNNVATIIVYPRPAAPPVSLGDVTNCFNVAVPVTLSVQVPGNFTADWYDSQANLLVSGSTNLQVVISGTNVLVFAGTNAPVTDTNGINTLGATNTFWAAARYNDPNFTNACSSGLTSVLLYTIGCTNNLSIAPLFGTNVLVQWNGNYLLQHNTNLLNSTGWTNIISGVGGSNGLRFPPTNSEDFFRLSAPTNWP